MQRSNACEADERITSWVSLSLRVFDFGMMPSVAVHGGTRRHHRDPAIRLSAAGWEGIFALKSLASAQPAGPRQQRSLRERKPVLSAGKSKILAVGGQARGQWLFGGGKEPRLDGEP